MASFDRIKFISAIVLAVCVILKTVHAEICILSECEFHLKVENTYCMHYMAGLKPEPVEAVNNTHFRIVANEFNKN